MKTNPIVVDETLHADAEKVWEAITDKDQMKKWYFDLSAFKPEVGFKFTFPGQGQKGQNYTHLCNVTEVIPHKKLQYSWQYEDYDGISRVTFELYAEGDKTRLKLTHEGLESFPKDNPDFARKSFQAGWTELITNLLPKYLASAY